MTPAEALRAMLSGTELAAVVDEKGGVTVRRERPGTEAEKNVETTVAPTAGKHLGDSQKKRDPNTAKGKADEKK